MKTKHHNFVCISGKHAEWTQEIAEPKIAEYTLVQIII